MIVKKPKIKEKREEIKKEERRKKKRKVAQLKHLTPPGSIGLGPIVSFF